jgi:hypothetical protein
MHAHLKKATIALGAVVFLSQLAGTSPLEDSAADAVSAAFVEARQAVHLTKLGQIGRNKFREKVCKHDPRMPSGLINAVHYQTSDPGRLPEAVLRLATSPDGSKVAARFGVGVCSMGPDLSGKLSYSVLIATYESQWTSFWRIVWE